MPTFKMCGTVIISHVRYDEIIEGNLNFKKNKLTTQKPGFKRRRVLACQGMFYVSSERCTLTFLKATDTN